MQRAVGLFDVAEDAAGADRGELLIITDQPDTCTSIDGELHGGVEVRVSAMPASSMITNVDGPTAAAQSGNSPCCSDQVSLARVSWADAGLLAKNSGSGCGRGQAEHLAAVLGPGQGQGLHGAGLPGAGRGDREL